MNSGSMRSELLQLQASVRLAMVRGAHGFHQEARRALIDADRRVSALVDSLPTDAAFVEQVIASIEARARTAPHLRPYARDLRERYGKSLGVEQ